jgi:methylmalonyl-CoA mutase cobalamin-binding domain/chain
MSLTRRRRKVVVVFVGDARGSDRGARALASSLEETGIEILYLGRATTARRIALSAAEAGAEAVEVCIARGGAVTLLRDLLRELKLVDRREISIVVHRVQ